MPSKDFSRMIEMGEWLEGFLNPDITVWDFRRLFEETLQILRIKDIYDLSGTWIEDMEKSIDMDDWHRFKRGDFSDFSGSNLQFFGMMILRNKVDNLLHEINKSGMPWEILIAAVVKKTAVYFEELKKAQLNKQYQRDPIEFKNNPIKFIGVNLSDKETAGKAALKGLITSYGDLADRYTLEGNKLVKSRGFQAGRRGYSNFLNSDGFDFTAAISNIFFDFLSLGGQDYYLYCKNCGRFTVIRRKGRKKYCSDICRTAAQRK